MHKLYNVQKTCLPEAVYLVDFEDRKLQVSEFNIHLSVEEEYLRQMPADFWQHLGRIRLGNEGSQVGRRAENVLDIIACALSRSKAVHHRQRTETRKPHRCSTTVALLRQMQRVGSYQRKSLYRTCPRQMVEMVFVPKVFMPRGSVHGL